MGNACYMPGGVSQLCINTNFFSALRDPRKLVLLPSLFIGEETEAWGHTGAKCDAGCQNPGSQSWQ